MSGFTRHDGRVATRDAVQRFNNSTGQSHRDLLPGLLDTGFF
jgi:hypothetical protein